MKRLDILINKLKDPGSALTHGIGMAAALIASVPLVAKAYSTRSVENTVVIAVFIVSMILLYAASTFYHSLNISQKVNKILRKIDHMMIYVLIAGTYTPICAIVLGDRTGWLMLFAVWAIAIGSLDQLSQGLFIGGIHSYGLGMYICNNKDNSSAP